MVKESTLNYTIRLNDGNDIPSLGLGTVPDPSSDELMIRTVKTAVRAGIRHIDTAWYYGSEPFIGRALKELFDDGEVKREDLFITTKVWPALWNRVEYSVKKSLSDLGIDYVDLVLHHWPVCYKGTDKSGEPKNPYVDGVLQFDENGDYLETYKQLIKLRDETKLTKSIGVSNYTEKHLQRVIDETGVVPVLNQIELHPRLPQKDLVRYFEERNVKIFAYSPLGSEGAPILKEDLVKSLAERYRTGVGSVALSYHILSGRGVICRSSNPERLKKFTELTPLTEEDIKQLDQLGIDDPKRFINDDWGVGLGFDNWKTKYSWESDE